ncbi:hypothetical protein QZH41_010559, partial [Actinostola sp. cb2023]
QIMDEHIPARDRLFYPLMDEPPEKKRRVDHATSGSSSIIDTIVNATSSWPLNSLNSPVLPSYDESIAANSYLPYYDREHYVSHSKNMDRNYNMLDNVPSARLDNVPSARLDNVPSGRLDNVPSARLDNVPSARLDNVPSGRLENVPSERLDNVPSGRLDNVPSGRLDNVPSRRLDNVPREDYTVEPLKEDYTPRADAQHNAYISLEMNAKDQGETGEESALVDDITGDATENTPRTTTTTEYSSTPTDMHEESHKKEEVRDLQTHEGDSKPTQILIKQEPDQESLRTPTDNGCQSPGVKMAEDAPTFQSPPVQNSNDSFGSNELKDMVKVEVKQETDKSDVDDSYSFLDWKDGIATLPGSNLKFKLSEFGTLEMVSTVETDKGEYEWTTADSAPPPSDLMRGPPDDGKVLCCEVCGVYGLPQDFCSSGRFCSLSCVGSYTGRRNKGREFVRNINPIERKMAKKKKKGKGKRGTTFKSVSPPVVCKDGEDSGFIDGTITTVATSPKVKTPREKSKGRHKIPPIEATGTCLTACMVPYNFSKPFTWTDYLYTSGTKPVPISIFKQENPDIDVFPMPCEEFKKNMKLEGVDPKHPSYICVCTIVRVKGARLRLHFDGWSECYDFWTNADSPDICPMGWCEKNGQTLHPPRSFAKGEFVWQKYLKKQSSVAAPEHLFSPVSKKRHGFEMGMKLEAIDRKNPDLICVATVTNVIGNRFLVHFDEWDDTYDYWCEEDCPYIHPVGWCESTGRRLTPPSDDEVNNFTWKQYLKTTGTKAAPHELFKIRPLPTFKLHQKLEAVDKRNPSLIRSTTVAAVQDYRVRVHFDGWDDVYDDWFDSNSTDLHSVGYCEKTGHPLEPPLTTADKISSVACPTPGCKGIGHVKGAKYSSHHSTFGCPYSLQNLNKESCLVDRLSTNSMTEESDWSYASKNKINVGGVRRGELSLDGVCPTPGCDGSGHISGHWRTHQSSAGCPKNEANVIKIPRPPIPIQPAPLKEPTSIPKKKVAPLTIVTNGASSKVLTSNTEPVSNLCNLFSEIPIKKEDQSQHTSISSYPPWKEGFDQTHPPTNDRKKSRERLRMSRWSADDVVKHVTSLGCVEQAKLFEEQKIDGESFLLLTQDDIVNILKIKLGPALKIFKSIPKV